MKTRTKHNNFPTEIHFYVLEDNYWECDGCGQNHANCLHHIFGRGHEEGCEKSILNACPLNNFECHLAKHGWLMTKEGRKAMFAKSIERVSKMNYTLKEVDNQFLEKYKYEIYQLGIKL